MKLTRLVAVAMLGAIGLVACGGRPGIKVSRAESGDAWPFTFDHGTLHCDRLRVTLAADTGVEYGLNGTAISSGFPDVTQKARRPGVGSVLPFIAQGMTLCEQTKR